MATRAATILTGIEDAILGATIDSKAHTGDIWQRMEAADDDQMMGKDRQFVVFPVSCPIRDNTFIGATTPAMANFSAQVSVGYARGGRSEIVSRVLQDAERIMYALEDYAASSNNSVAEITQSAATISPFDQGLVVEFEVNITYSIDLS